MRCIGKRDLCQYVCDRRVTADSLVLAAEWMTTSKMFAGTDLDDLSVFDPTRYIAIDVIYNSLVYRFRKHTQIDAIDIH